MHFQDRLFGGDAIEHTKDRINYLLNSYCSICHNTSNPDECKYCELNHRLPGVV